MPFQALIRVPTDSALWRFEEGLKSYALGRNAAEFVVLSAAEYTDPDDRAYLPSVDGSVDVLYARPGR